ncbi:AAA family ATPase [Gayadomonas joobiniege]|uniref:AAA family ATPase n=1 Tax=Gayadomonas joobiniege TaxID=1234606 RepID=UPI0003815BF4|nr:ATP-binding protein [Gayadomonas joobiniege]
MIIDLSIKNFRSIKTEQLISFHADKKPKHHSGNISYIEEDIGILKTCAVYGSNAAGKTNIILAFEALQDLIISSGDLKDGEPIDSYDPYLLCDSTSREPTRIEIEFYVETLRYRYQIEFNRNEISFEKLDYYPSARPANLFTRNSSHDWKAVKFGEHYKGGKKQIAFFANNAYLSKAGNTPDSPEIVRKIFNYFRRYTDTLLVGQIAGVSNWDEDENTVKIINTFLNKVDLGIESFGIEEEPDKDQFEFPSSMPENIQRMFRKELSKKEYFFHPNSQGDLVRFEKDRESRGTSRLFRLLPFFIQVIRDGSVLFVDEIESSFHPHIAELIIKLFNDPLVNKKNAQLIFTTHDLVLMGSDTMRKDQIYLTEKDQINGTQLYCLDSYDSDLKDSSPFAKWYDEGRLGAIPRINYKSISDVIKKVF